MTKPTGSGEDGSMRASAEREWQAPTTPEPWTRRDNGRARAGGHRGSGGRRPERRARHTRRQATTRGGDVARGLTGSLAAGLAVLALTLTGVQLWSDAQGKFGPGVGVVVGHFVVAAVALLLQAVADRRRDGTGGLCALGVVVTVLSALTYWWWL